MMRILVAEDNPINSELLRELLELRGHEVVEVANGWQALARIEQACPDLVMLDIQMPLLDGFGVIRNLRQNQRFAGLKIVALTAYAMEGDREKVMTAGFDGYLTKPIDTADLDEMLARLLNRPSALA